MSDNIKRSNMINSKSSSVIDAEYQIGRINDSESLLNFIERLLRYHDRVGFLEIDRDIWNQIFVLISQEKIEDPVKTTIGKATIEFQTPHESLFLSKMNY